MAIIIVPTLKITEFLSQIRNGSSVIMALKLSKVGLPGRKEIPVDNAPPPELNESERVYNMGINPKKHKPIKTRFSIE
jgi:hypothetical protein